VRLLRVANFQNTLFPAGLEYDLKKEHYWTIEANEVIGYITGLSMDLDEIKKPNFPNFEEKYDLVRYRSDLSNLLDDF